MSAKILNPNDDVCKKLWRDEGGKPRYWNRMTAGSCSETQVWESFRYWNMMLARHCGGGHGGTTYETKWMQEVVEGRDYRYWNPMNAGSLGSLMRGTRGGSLDIETRWIPQARHFHPSWHQVEPLHNWEFPEEVWQVEIEKKAECEGGTEALRHWNHTMYWNASCHVALHGSAALAPSCLKNCDQDAAGESIHRGYGVGKGQVQQEGAQVQQRIIVRSMKSVQAQKKWNEVELNSI